MKNYFYGASAVLLSLALPSTATAETIQYAVDQALNAGEAHFAVIRRYDNASSQSEKCSAITEARSTAQRAYHAWSRALEIANSQGKSSNSELEKLRGNQSYMEDEMKRASSLQDDAC